MAEKAKSARSYSDKLRDPRWQRRRLEIMARDNWTCQRCGTATDMLQVHHRFYLSGREPWDYADAVLVTLCESCHKAESDGRKIEAALVKVLDGGSPQGMTAMSVSPKTDGADFLRRLTSLGMQFLIELDRAETVTSQLVPRNDGRVILRIEALRPVGRHRASLSCRERRLPRLIEHFNPTGAKR